MSFKIFLTCCSPLFVQLESANATYKWDKLVRDAEILNKTAAKEARREVEAHTRHWAGLCRPGRLSVSHDAPGSHVVVVYGAATEAMRGPREKNFFCRYCKGFWMIVFGVPGFLFREFRSPHIVHPSLLQYSNS
uniref:Uncharacterized protein n=1 Tax=Rhodosorus marinus TaxID=101924 RepID=A0A7S2ZYP1_9RHOD|mmetsp:Transcript_3680/g.16205  ORF Transcript_3680/g.16205 Transcript_3680/m.16205 type:complete len:134 (+) Transcript_3680:771-1172(+)